MTSPKIDRSQSAGQQFVASSTLPLPKLLDCWDPVATRYVLVRNPEGVIDGMLDLHEVQRRLTAENPVERERWERATVAALAETVMSAPPDHDSPSSPIVEFTAEPIFDTVGCAAIIANGETFVSWQRVCQAIGQNQIDPVTLLPTRVTFNRRLAEELDRARRTKRGIAVLMVDLDYFKSINDRFGHSTGDLALRSVANCLRNGIRSYDFVARFGGDEFAMIYSDCKPGNLGLPIARLLQDLAQQPPVDPTTGTRISLSIGAAVMASVDEYCSPEIVFEQADACLYHAKRNGRARAIGIELDPFGIPLTAPVQVSPVDDSCGL